MTTKVDTTIDDEMAARIQDFVSWASSKGYHVIGGLIAKEPALVKTFATGPDGSFETQTAHVQRLARILYNTVMMGTIKEGKQIPLGRV